MNYYHKTLNLLRDLKEAHPSYSLGRHIASIIETDGDLWGVSDKELFYMLSKYLKQMALDKPHNDNELDAIIKEGLNLSQLREDLYNTTD